MKINYNISEKVTCSHQGDPHSPLAGSRNKPPAAPGIFLKKNYD